MTRFVMALSLSLSSSFAIAQGGDGRLPRAKPKKNNAIEKLKSTHKTPVTAPKGDSKKDKIGRPDICHAYLASPIQDRLHIGGENIYYMKRQARVPGSKLSYKYNMKSFSLERKNKGKLDKGLLQSNLFTVQGPKNIAFITHEKPAIGYTVLSFVGIPTGCARGFGVGVSVPLLKNRSVQKKPGRSLKSAEYKIVSASSGSFFADMTKGVVATIDPGTFQRRRAFTYLKKDIPLYWDAPKKNLYVWRAEESALLRLGSFSKDPIGRLVIKDGEKLLQQKNKFGIIRSNVISNTVGIAEINKWSHIGRSRIYKMEIPKEINVKEASYKVNFKRKKLVVFAGSPATKEYFSSVYLFDYAKNKLLTKLRLQTGELLDSVELSPSGNELLVFINSRSTGLASSLKVYDGFRKEWLAVKL